VGLEGLRQEIEAGVATPGTTRYGVTLCEPSGMALTAIGPVSCARCEYEIRYMRSSSALPRGTPLAQEYTEHMSSIQGFFEGVAKVLIPSQMSRPNS
jgi:hypothetical protein